MRTVVIQWRKLYNCNMLKNPKPTEYMFLSHWVIHAGTAKAAHAITDVSHWTDWWEGLESVEVKESTQAATGSRFACVWKSSSGYRLALNICITEYIEEEVMRFTADGDLAGSGTWRIEPVSANRTAMTILWNVSTTKTWMNTLAPALRPVFVKSHNALMKKGEQGLNVYMQSI